MLRPPIIDKLQNELNELIMADNQPDIPADKVADMLNIDKAKFRNMIYLGQVPFAIGATGGKYGRGYCKVSKLALWCWVTKEAATL